MSRRDERLAQQAQAERDMEADVNQRPNIPPTPVPASERCYTGDRHDYSMRGPDGIYRCWTCCQRKPETKNDPAKDARVDGERLSPQPLTAASDRR